MNFTFNTRCPYHKRKCKCSYGSHPPTKLQSRQISPTRLSEQIVGYEPFDCFPGSGRLTQELLRWHHVPIFRATGADKWITLFASDLIEGWLKTALANVACYYSYAASVVRLQRRVTGNASIVKREHLFRSYAARHLSKVIGLDQQAKWLVANHEAVALSIALQLDLAVADEEVGEAGFHAAALGVVCTQSLVAQMKTSNWLSVWHVSTKYAMWLSLGVPIPRSLHHPAFEYIEDDFSPAARSYANDQASQLLDLLPSPITDNIDSLTLFSIFRRQFIYTFEASFASSPRTCALVGLQHHLQADLCTYVSTLWKQIEHKDGNVAVMAAYCVLATVQLTTYAVFSFSPYSETVCGVGWSVALIRRLVQVLKNIEAACPYYWNNYGSRSCLAWILFISCAYSNLAERTRQPGGRDLVPEICSCHHRYYFPSGIQGTLEIEEAIQHFPWFASVFSTEIAAVQDVYDNYVRSLSISPKNANYSNKLYKT